MYCSDGGSRERDLFERDFYRNDNNGVLLALGNASFLSCGRDVEGTIQGGPYIYVVSLGIYHFVFALALK